jgi:hypothetical protein
MATTPSSPLSRHQVRETLFALAGVAHELSSESEAEDDHDEPILVETLLEAALNGGLQAQLPFNCIRMPHSPRTRLDRLGAACHLCVEIAQSTQFVFYCFHCHSFILGYLCYVHHTRSCLNAEFRVTFRERVFAAPLPWRWIDCDYCVRQEVLASRHHKISSVSTVIHWARFLTGLVPRRIRHAPLRCSTASWANRLRIPPEVECILLDAL